jgi:signal transduction histidine kinase
MLFTETIVCPLEELVDATRSVHGGDLSARVPVQSADELGILQSSFNEMAAGLQSARERQVTAREEERRRLRRDLHDGLGPSLAALVIRLELADGLLGTDPAAARTVIGELKSEAQNAVTEIRRLVYELRPPSLDELGLVGAIRENAARLMPPGGPAFTVTAPERLPSLPAAVEVAAYRIAQEAMTNLVRHSGASSCDIRVDLNGALELEVRDDGCGLGADHRVGVGLASMRERAAELGGRCTVETAARGGTIVRAELPV